MKASNPGLCDGDDCTSIDFMYAIAITLLSGAVVIILQPLTKEIEFGDGKIVNCIEDYLEDFFAMLVRGFTVIVVVLWNYAIGNWIGLGLGDVPAGTHQLYNLLWAFTATMGGEAATSATMSASDALLASILSTTPATPPPSTIVTPAAHPPHAPPAHRRFPCRAWHTYRSLRADQLASKRPLCSLSAEPYALSMSHRGWLTHAQSHAQAP